MSEEKTLENRCLWHKNSSIPKDNPSYESCHESCDGHNQECVIYTPRKEYFRNTAHLRKKEHNKDGD